MEGKYVCGAKKFVYKSYDDKNGVIYWIGTNYGKDNIFMNPYDSNKIKILSE